MVAHKVKICLQCSTPGLNSWVQEFPRRREYPAIPTFLREEFYGQRSLVGWATDWTEFFLPGYLLVQLNLLKGMFALLPLIGFFQCSFGKKKKKRILCLLLLLHDNTYCNHVLLFLMRALHLRQRCFLINLCSRRDR